METSTELTAKCFKLKRKGVIQKFPVDNWGETPMMFVAKRDSPFVRATAQQINDMLQEDRHGHDIV